MSAPAPRRLDGAEHVRRATARADADDRVLRIDLERRDVRGACLGVVLGSLLHERSRAAMPPATSATTCPGAAENVDSHSEASSAASRPDEPAPT